MNENKPLHTNLEALPNAVERYLAELDSRLHKSLGDSLVGAYLHGSAVLGGFNAVISDLDVLTVVDRPLTVDERDELAKDLSKANLPSPAKGLEMSVVTLDSTKHPVDRPKYELHIAAQEDKVVVDQGKGDPDLVLHYAVCRQSARPLGSAPPPTTVFGEVPHSLVLSQIENELAWTIETPGVPSRYLVLNACRAWCFLETGKLVSKVEGGQWAKERSDSSSLIQSALDAQLSTDDAQSSPEKASVTFAKSVMERLKGRETD